jgi:hypothetical protein
MDIQRWTQQKARSGSTEDWLIKLNYGIDSMEGENYGYDRGDLTNFGTSLSCIIVFV